jgi:creatinine amidohydrolase
MAFRDWQAATGGGGLDPVHTIALLPLAATEQHGPHLPIATDRIIADGLVAEASRRAPAALDVVRFPTEAVGVSLEHLLFPGTLSVTAADFIQVVVARAEEVSRVGLRKLVIISSHGGNIPAMQAAALEARLRFDLLVVTLTWNRLGYPPGLLSEEERQFGAHGGQMETSLMLHLAPNEVDMEQARDFPSLQAELAKTYKHLRAYGPIGFGWLAGDLNPEGVTGNAAAGSAEIGEKIAAHQAAAFVELLEEVAQADINTLLR